MRPSSTDAIVLKNTSTLFLILEIVGVIGLTVGLSVAGDELASSGGGGVCGWCSQNGFDEAMRSLVVADDRIAAAVLSHRLSVAFLPLLAILGVTVPAFFTERGGRRRSIATALQNFVPIVGVFLLTTSVAGLVKGLASRERPGFFHGAVTEASALPFERFASFFSGDTAWAFGFAAVGATLAYLRGYRTARPLAIIGGIAAFATAFLRMRADMHWATDVMMGATVGTLLGAGIPLLLHRRAAIAAPSAAPVIPIAQSHDAEEEEKKAA